MSHEPTEDLSTYHARLEAESLFAMLGRDGNTVDSIRKLIGLDAHAERVLRAFAAADPGEADWVEGVLKFRNEVLRQFNRLLREGLAKPKPAVLKPAPPAQTVVLAPVWHQTSFWEGGGDSCGAY